MPQTQVPCGIQYIRILAYILRCRGGRKGSHRCHSSSTIPKISNSDLESVLLQNRPPSLCVLQMMQALFCLGQPPRVTLALTGGQRETNGTTMFTLPHIEPKPYFYLPLKVGFPPVANTTHEDIAAYIEHEKEQRELLRRQQAREDEEWVRKAMVPHEIF